ncbi:immunity 42 family protein [Chromobacterium haemolyticum]|uniref:immunity 42 family protein n=1 Tax=Chromobacterium haemolyticum TaxID=394935 RepID=UPI0013191451|nr:immunity 42 family protein [Chromobacterium haemolyticum]BBH12823.1 hypothetical protein CH06BL_20710 [Chromobacterium haemolyticum]
MIFGDPYKFAVLIQCIPEWCDDAYKNGVFHFCIDGKFFPDVIGASTIFVDAYSLIDDSSPLIEFQENKGLFELDVEAAFRELLAMISPDFNGGHESDFFEQNLQYKISTENIEEHGFIAFAVGCKSSVRVMCAKCYELKNDEKGQGYWGVVDCLNITEAVVDKAELVSMMTSVKEYVVKALS